MKDEEKNLIENLFHRLRKTELSSSERDEKADFLIQNLVKKQPCSSYYMVQTILIQETAIKKMGLKIEQLENEISSLKADKANKRSSFLSSFLKKDKSSQPTISNDNNIWKKNQNILEPNSYTPSSTVTNTSNNGFLKNALQTATGVAGGMILGNMLMNVFKHSDPEEQIFDNVNEVFISDTDEYNTLNDSNYHDNLINYDDTQTESIHSASEDDNFSNFDDLESADDNEINDDNFI